jgi:hypothetical protein
VSVGSGIAIAGIWVGGAVMVTGLESALAIGGVVAVQVLLTGPLITRGR